MIYVLSQNKEVFVKVDGLTIDEDELTIIPAVDYSYEDTQFTILGKYKSTERCKEIILDFASRLKFVTEPNMVFLMPQE